MADPPLSHDGSEPSSGFFSTAGNLRALKRADPATHKVFLSYRRADSAGYAGRLFDRLAERFGRDGLFMDVDAIEAGADFVEAIGRAVASCRVVVVLIGPRWLEIEDASGNRRLDDPEDFVRLEVQAALEHGRSVIPVLVDGARMPDFDDLPEALVGLARRNAIELTASRWDFDVGRLLVAIEGKGVRPVGSRRRVGPWAAAGVALALVIGGGLWSRRAGDGASPEASGAPEPPVAAEAVVEARPSLAVTGMVTDEEGEESEWLETALAEMIETGLGLGGQVRTVGGEEVATARRSLGLPTDGLLPGEDLVRLGRALGVDYLIDGEFERSGGDLLRIDLDLRRSGDGSTLAQGRTTGTANQLFDVVGRALRPLREALGIEDLSPAEALVLKAALPTDPRAARLYAEGLEALRAFDAPEARDRFERAVEAEPDHPMAHAGLARALRRAGYLDRAAAAAARAVELAGQLAEPVQLHLDAQSAELAEDWPLAIRRYQELRERYPDDLSVGLALADLRISHGETMAALDDLRRLSELPAPLGDDPGIALVRARAEFRAGEYEAMKASAEKAIEAGEDLGAELTVARGLLYRASAEQELGNADEALRDLDAAQSRFAAAGDLGGEAEVLERKGIAAYRAGDYDGAERLFRRVVELSDEAGHHLRVAILRGTLGKLAREQGRFDEAERSFRESLEMARELEAGYETAQSLNELAILAFLVGDLPEARDLYREALVEYSRLSARDGQAIVLTNLGEIAFLQADLDEAEEAHAEALALNREIGDDLGVGYDTYRLGLVALYRGDLDVAEARLAEAEGLFEAQGDLTSAAETRIARSRLELERGRPDQAAETAGSAAEILESEGLADLALRARAAAAIGREGTGDHPQASDLLSRSRDLADRTEDLQTRVAFTLAEAAVTPGGSEEALRRVESLAAELEERDLLLQRMELEIARAGLVAALGREADARSRLESVAAQAEESGVLLLERSARAALAAI